MVLFFMSRLDNKIENFSNAVKRLQEAIVEFKKDESNTLIQDALIQRFEFTFEVSWKTTKDYLIEKGVKDEISFPKDVLKEAFANGMITNEDEWLSMLKARNITSHIYDSETASKIAKKIANDYIVAFMELYTYFL